MPLVPTLLILWPLALIGLTLTVGAILDRLPGQCDDIWRLPRATPWREGIIR